MARMFAPTAYWMTVSDGIPRHHANRFIAIRYARDHHVRAYRQDAETLRIDLVYEPMGDTEYKPHEQTVKEGVR